MSFRQLVTASCCAAVLAIGTAARADDPSTYEWTHEALAAGAEHTSVGSEHTIELELRSEHSVDVVTVSQGVTVQTFWDEQVAGESVLAGSYDAAATVPIFGPLHGGLVIRNDVGLPVHAVELGPSLVIEHELFSLRLVCVHPATGDASRAAWRVCSEAEGLEFELTAVLWP